MLKITFIVMLHVVFVSGKVHVVQSAKLWAFAQEPQDKAAILVLVQHNVVIHLAHESSRLHDFRPSEIALLFNTWSLVSRVKPLSIAHLMTQSSL